MAGYKGPEAGSVRLASAAGDPIDRSTKSATLPSQSRIKRVGGTSRPHFLATPMKKCSFSTMHGRSDGVSLRMYRFDFALARAEASDVAESFG